jgi:hypothetical protein
MSTGSRSDELAAANVDAQDAHIEAAGTEADHRAIVRRPDGALVAWVRRPASPSRRCLLELRDRHEPCVLEPQRCIIG